MINTKNIMLAIILIFLNNLPASSFDDESDLESSARVVATGSWEFDEERQRFYTGSSLSEVRSSLREEQAPDYLDEYRVVFHTNEEQETNQNLISAAYSWENDVFHDCKKLKENHGVPSDGIDRRTPSPSHDDHPWHAHGKLLSIFTDGKEKSYTSIGSGTLIGERTVLTAAHNLYDFKEKLAAGLVVFYPGRNGDKFLCRGMSIKTIIHPQYYSTKESDIGVVILGEAFSDEAKAKNIKFVPVKDFRREELLGQEVHVTGYPGGVISGGEIRFLEGNYMYTMSGLVKNIHEDSSTIFYDIDTSAGQSGGAVCHTDGESHVCCGVHIKGGTKAHGNIGTFLNQSYYELLINNWLKAI